MLIILNLPRLTEVLDEIDFLERERTDHQVVELASPLYNFRVNFRRVAHVPGWIGVKWSDGTVWNWIQKFGPRLNEVGRRPAADLPAVLLTDETAIKACLSLAVPRHSRNREEQITTKSSGRMLLIQPGSDLFVHQTTL